MKLHTEVIEHDAQGRPSKYLFRDETNTIRRRMEREPVYGGKWVVRDVNDNGRVLGTYHMRLDAIIIHTGEVA